MKSGPSSSRTSASWWLAGAESGVGSRTYKKESPATGVLNLREVSLVKGLYLVDEHLRAFRNSTKKMQHPSQEKAILYAVCKAMFDLAQRHVATNGFHGASSSKAMRADALGPLRILHHQVSRTRNIESKKVRSPIPTTIH